jgi:hypothetical protein
LTYSAQKLYRVPDDIFRKLPFGPEFYGALLNVMVRTFNIQADLYNPRRLLTAYSDPVREYIESIRTPDKQLLLVGSGAGGIVAKVIGMHFGIKAIAYNSPEAQLWFMGDLSQPAVDLSFLRNVLIKGQVYTGTETGGTVEYIPFDKFPMNPASSSAVTCILAVQCRVYEHFEDFCTKWLPEDILKELHDDSPYH